MSMSAPALDSPVIDTDWHRLRRMSLIIVVLTFGVFGGWSFFARLDSAAVAQGVVTAASNIKTIQHLEGGIVEEIHVRNGDKVKAGDLLVRLDPTKAKSSALLYRRQLAAALASQARLTAERQLSYTVQMPEEVTRLAKDDPTVQGAINDVVEQFQTGLSVLNQKIDVLKSQNLQIGQEIEGLKVQKKVSQDELNLINGRLAGLDRLLKRKLITNTQVDELRRDGLQLAATVAKSDIEMARARQRIVENELNVQQAKEDYREAAATNMPQLTKDIRELRSQLIIAEDQLRRTDVVAPIDGTVQELQVFTVGGVVRPGDAIMNIAPQSDNLVVQARFSPLDIDGIHPGMEAEIQFPAFQRLDLDPMRGTVVSTSRDRIVDKATNTAYFAGEVSVDPKSVPSFIKEKMTAGLTASVIVPTGARTVLDYLLSPLVSRMDSAMREK
ncbi:HlyD family type I secretion periplasmic adaptor subunit [Aurantimonas sp. VKM B-3413]|uniref:HlyD family type I secretion periplasmic adaptor subunit n=1 Tax=Aurantimonas sp. VKM B-3413 TaxID=2779401 RepID=UPI001E5E4C70|nr:HlyD family type I secretion periplasmic adaptor subunit [Aurantimonas sp. VKM B-3413]MCB8836488.1 HlyD family type I secretion periplasmic adaptor subunit [Aurantimonas sp. VKM B-3413]